MTHKTTALDTVNSRTSWHLLSRASQLLLGLSILLLVGHFVVYVVYAVNLIRFPFDYDQGEGFELVDTIMFSEGEWPYQHNETYPFYASNYPPLFHIILVPFVWLFGPGYWYGRLVAFLGTLLTASVIGYLVYREGRHRQIAVISGLAFLASNYIYHIGPLFRQHMTMVLFETLAVLVLAHVTDIEDPRRRRRAMVIGLALILAAGLTKQLALATVVAVFGFLFIRNPRRSLVWGVLFGAAAGAVFLLINVATHGEWWNNIIAANVNEFMPNQFTNLFKQWFRLHSVLIIMAGLTIVYELYFARLSLYSIWWVLAVVDTGLAGKWGAGDSYFATAIAASCVLAGITAARTLRGEWDFSTENVLSRLLKPVRARTAAYRVPLMAVAGIVVPVLYLYYGLSVVHLPTEGAVFGPLTDTLGLESSYGDRYAFYDSAGWVQGYATIGHLTTQDDIDNGWRIVDIVRESDLPAMSEEAAFSIRADKDIVTNPTQLKNLYENDLFDPSHLIDAIQQHDFGVVVFRAQFYPPPVLDAVYEAYYPAETIVMNGFNYEIWRPGPPQTVRIAVAEKLEAAVFEAAVPQVLSLPFDQARLWLVHTMTHHNWEKQPEQPDTEPGQSGCLSGTFQRGDHSLSTELCPTQTGSELTMMGMDS